MKKKLRLILLIDDDHPTNCFNQMMIEDEDVAEEIRAIQSAGEALDYLSNRGKYQNNGVTYPAPDLIFLDINMPAMNGWEFLEAYRQLPEFRRSAIVVVMLTASPNPDDAAMAHSLPSVSGFFNKPLSPATLQQVLQEHFLEYC